MSEVETAENGAEAARPQENEKTPERTEGQQEPAAAEPGSTEEKPKKRSDGGFQRRINELTWKTRELERQLQAERAERERLLRQNQPQPEPDDPVSLVRHLAQQEALSLLEQRQREAQERETQRKMEELQRNFQRRVEDFADEHPDFFEAVETLDAMAPLPPEAVEIICSSELGPQVTYYLAQNLDEAQQIASLPPHLAAARLARIEAKLAAPRQPKPTQAPNPPPVLGGSAVPKKDPAQMTYAEYKKWRSGG